MSFIDSNANGTVYTDSANLPYWQGQSTLSGSDIIEDIDVPAFSRVQLVFTRTTPTGTREDVMVCSRDWASCLINSASPLSASDKAVVETALNTWWTTCKALTVAQYTLAEYRWFDYEPINTRPGPMVRLTTNGAVGTAGTGRVPDQLAITQTFKTLSRKHWGRWYLPVTCQGALEATYGRVASGTVTALQAATRTLLQTTGGSGTITPVVGSIQYHGVLTIRELQTDNIWDIVRRRRAKNPSQRLTNTS